MGGCDDVGDSTKGDLAIPSRPIPAVTESASFSSVPRLSPGYLRLPLPAPIGGVTSPVVDVDVLETLRFEDRRLGGSALPSLSLSRCDERDDDENSDDSLLRPLLHPLSSRTHRQGVTRDLRQGTFTLRSGNSIIVVVNHSLFRISRRATTAYAPSRGPVGGVVVVDIVFSIAILLELHRCFSEKRHIVYEL